MDFKIIDFHTHPFITRENNICSHTDYCHMSPQNTVEVLKSLGISGICGSVIRVKKREGETDWDKIRENNDLALQIREMYGDFYIPGFHVHPNYVEQSVEEIHRMHEKGVRLIGELVPYLDGWDDYSCEGFSAILDEAEKYGMVVNFHSMYDDNMDEMVKRHKNVVFVAAHPGEYNTFMRHMERMKMSENYYLDLSGTGLFRYGMLRHAIDCVGAERILFGTDFPTCNPSMYVGGVMLDGLLTDREKELILAGNAKRLLGL